MLADRLDGRPGGVEKPPELGKSKSPSTIAAILQRQPMEASVDWLRTYGRRLYHSVLHDVRQRYAGSFLGSLWAILYPLSLLSFYATIYVVVFKVRAPGLTPADYTVMVMAGLVPIIMFTEALSMGLVSVQSQKSLLLNTVFPAELLPVRAVLAGQVPSASALVITFLAAMWQGQTSALLVLVMVPIFWALQILFVTGLAWVLSLVVLIARDVQQAIGIVFMAVMVLSPLGYTPEMVPESLKFIIWLNPMSYFVLCFQSVLAFGRFPDLTTFGIAVLLGTVSFAGGLYFFRRTKFVFMDYA
jgi:lipopolysaccharide transport system permease protein